jgi:hypothetical protein
MMHPFKFGNWFPFQCRFWAGWDLWLVVVFLVLVLAVSAVFLVLDLTSSIPYFDRMPCFFSRSSIVMFAREVGGGGCTEITGWGGDFSCGRSVEAEGKGLGFVWSLMFCPSLRHHSILVKK